MFGLDWSIAMAPIERVWLLVEDRRPGDAVVGRLPQPLVA
jgi:hypothetical protein